MAQVSRLYDECAGEKGFSLVEMLVVFGLVASISALIIPLGVDFFNGFYRGQILNEVEHDTLIALRRVQHQSISQKNDSRFGVKFLEGSYILFQGNSYNEPGRVTANDETTILSPGVLISGMEEVVFEKLSGMPIITPSGAEELIISAFGISRIIHINAQGKIEKQ